MLLIRVSLQKIQRRFTELTQDNENNSKKRDRMQGHAFLRFENDKNSEILLKKEKIIKK